MPAKKKKRKAQNNMLVKEAKGVYDAYKDKLLMFIVNFLEDQLGSMMSWVRNVSVLKEKIQKIVVATVLGISGTVLLLLGVAGFVASAFNMSSAASHLIVGLLVVIISLLYSKS